jgi:K+ transporter
MNSKLKTSHITKLTLTGLIVTLGIVYGDLGTSPLYVMKAIVSGATAGISSDFIFGAISCIIWTLTLQSTLKYVLITLRADNNGEGGIFSLYALIRKKKRWTFVLAIIGGAALLADGIITPSITVISAVEGLNLFSNSISVVPIALLIITAIFVIQQFGTKLLGESFGPIMFIWFLMLGVLGVSQIVNYPQIINAFNPYYAVKLLTEYPGGFLLLGAVFLCTTGAEALYSDLGHCGLANIRVTWIYVKICLILNYLGQGAWVLNNVGKIVGGTNPFFMIMPHWFLIIGVFISTAAAVIASQALISGSYTIISEAILLNFWPKVKISYPTTIKGQMYIPSVNWILYAACVCVILFFQESSNMEAAYGLSITITMLMTTLLLSFYLRLRKIPIFYIGIFLLTYLCIEGSFLIANLHKFSKGGWVTILIAGIIFFIMFVWYRGRNIKKQFTEFVKVRKYYPVLIDLSKDESIQKYSTNLVYMTKANYKSDIEQKIIYSIINKKPKRADCYWFLHLDVLDEPHTMEYKVETLIPDVLIRVDFRIGFKVQPRVNLFFKQVLEELVKNNELDMLSHYSSLRKHHIAGDFRFVIIDRIQNYDFDFSPFDQFIMDIYSILKRIGITDVKAYGLDTSNVLVEKVPLVVEREEPPKLKRIYNGGKLKNPLT